jgi:hypothetical protein
MAMRSVGFQLVTAGKAQVRNDFAEVKADGVASVTAIGLAAESSASKAAKAVDDLTEKQIASYRRQANAAKLVAAGALSRNAFDAALATPTSQQFATVNTDRPTGSARRSAEVFEAADRENAAAAAAAAEADRAAARAADDRSVVGGAAALCLGNAGGRPAARFGRDRRDRACLRIGDLPSAARRYATVAGWYRAIGS